jgi:hypothetical protein
MKDTSVHGLDKLPDSVVISQLRQELGKSNAYIDELKDQLKEREPRKIKQGTLISKDGEIKNLKKQLKKYRAMAMIQHGREDDLNHWCSYNGIDDLNKRELNSIILQVIASIEI